MIDSREVLELKEKIDCLEEEKAEAERICSNMEESLSKAVSQYKSVSELLSKEQQENVSLKEQIKELECELKYSENQRMEILNRCDELEKQLDYKRELPHSPLEAVDFLVHDRYKRGASALEKRMFGDCEEIEELRYNIDELEQIAEHLLIYCKHNRGCE